MRVPPACFQIIRSSYRKCSTRLIHMESCSFQLNINVEQINKSDKGHRFDRRTPTVLYCFSISTYKNVYISKVTYSE